MSPKERVVKGATLLDEMEPGWYQKIDLVTLNLRNCFSCVIGQVYGEYTENNLTRLGLDFSRDTDFGFDVSYDDDVPAQDSCYYTLTSLWKNEILQRREKDLS